MTLVEVSYLQLILIPFSFTFRCVLYDHSGLRCGKLIAIESSVFCGVITNEPRHTAV